MARGRGAGGSATAVVLGLVMTLLVLPGTVASARTSGVYADDDSSVHEGTIEALAVSSVTRGCDHGRFCPDQTVTRGQMAAFLVRALRLPASSTDRFVDDDGHLFESDAQALAAAGITRGCNEARGWFCPDRRLTRGEMAALLVRALEIASSAMDRFVDDDGHLFEADAQALAAHGLTRGCDPPDNRRFCPDERVTRAQMASFLVRAEGYRAPWPTAGTTCTRPEWPCTASDATHPVVLSWNGIDLRLPSSGAELVGLHQSNHDGARSLTRVGDAVRTVLLDDRGRDTSRTGAADVVAHPEVEVRAAVTGRVVRAGTYRLYCRYSDDYLVVEPDGRPGIEVKMLHIDGVRVSAGDRVVAGVTVVARRPTVLPFASQVDEVSGPEDWPHVHVEVVDTSIPDRPSPGGGC